MKNKTPGGESVSARAASIRAMAVELGFSHVGFAAADPLVNERAGLEQWLAQGMHADMLWMARDTAKRCDPSAVLPGARSVVAVALNYYTPQRHSNAADVGKISRYAWGDDYHDVLGEKLGMLELFIHELAPEVETRRYVDTGPMMDKAWAVRAGIGWLGKNGNVLTRDMGSWIFLGEIITTLELGHDAPIDDFCGSCTACLDACPTQAIVSPAVVDSRRCISYLTIEHRGETLPLPEGTTLDSWVFGCDVCQDVCPWNSFAKESEEEAFEPRPWNISPALMELSELGDEEFRTRYRHSAIKRCKPSGLRRNARTVLQRDVSNLK